MHRKTGRAMNSSSAVPNLLRLSRQAVAACLAGLADSAAAPLLAVDCTCGNGHDCLFLARTLAALDTATSGVVLGLDVQPAALEATRNRLAEENLEHHAHLLLRGHENLAAVLDSSLSGLSNPAVVMYNLGFLPGSDKRLTTRSDSTLASLNAAAAALLPSGLLCVHAYGGHPDGIDELRAVETWCVGLPFDEWVVGRYNICNRVRNPESLFLAEKRG